MLTVGSVDELPAAQPANRAICVNAHIDDTAVLTLVAIKVLNAFFYKRHKTVGSGREKDSQVSDPRHPSRQEPAI